MKILKGECYKIANFERYFEEDQVMDILFSPACIQGDRAVACKFCRAYEGFQKLNRTTLIERPPLYLEKTERTYLGDFLEKFPDTKRLENRAPVSCLKDVYNIDFNCLGYYCDKVDNGKRCWDK